MAFTYLAGGRDVVMPQFIGDVAELSRFEQVAAETDATFLEVVLMDERASAIKRFRARDDGSEWARHNAALVEGLGGDLFLGALYDQLLEVVAARPQATVVRSVAGQVEQTHAAVEAAVRSAR